MEHSIGRKQRMDFFLRSPRGRTDGAVGGGSNWGQKKRGGIDNVKVRARIGDNISFFLMIKATARMNGYR